jgi:hypothetical protein
MTFIDTSNSRFPKAVAIADQAGQWIKCRAKDGRKAYGVPSSKGDGRFYLVTQTTCDCYDAQRHICKHSIAVQIHCARVAGIGLPASDVVDGLAQMVTDRQAPVLDMIREEDGSIRWERHEHANGEQPSIECGCVLRNADGLCSHQTPPLPRISDPETVRLAARYNEIFGSDSPC